MKDGKQKPGPVLLCYSRPAMTTAAGWGAEDEKCFRGKCSWMERGQPSTASLLPEEARTLGHYTCSEFGLELFIQSSVLVSLTWSSTVWGLFPCIAYNTALPCSNQQLKGMCTASWSCEGKQHLSSSQENRAAQVPSKWSC